MDEEVHAKENHGDSVRPAAKQRPSRKPLGEIQANNLVAQESIPEDGKKIAAKHDASEASARGEQPHEENVHEPAGTATTETLQEMEAGVNPDVSSTARSEPENAPGTSELNVSTSLSAREYEAALEDEIIARLNTLQEMYTSHFRSEQRSMREKYLEEDKLGTPRQVREKDGHGRHTPRACM